MSFINYLTEMDGELVNSEATHWFKRFKKAKQDQVFDLIENQKFDILKYIGENWRVYEVFRHFALEACKKNVKVSAVMILERIRWEVKLSKVDGDKFKVNNSARPFLARFFTSEYPEYKDYFDFRISKNTKQDKKYQK